MQRCTGTLTALDPAEPEGVPDDHVIQPFRIALTHQRRHWLTGAYELDHDEIDSTQSMTHGSITRMAT